MNKIALLLLFSLTLLTTFPIQQASAAFQPPPGETFLAAYYNEWRNEYRAVYSKQLLGQNYDAVRVYFETDLGTPYERDYPASAMRNASAYWLTCNGQYQFQYLSGSQIVAYSDIITTSQINSPTCDSYPDGGAADDANANYTDNPDGSYQLNWSDIPGSSAYQVWEDGNLIGTFPSDPSGQYTMNIPAPGGGISIVGIDGNGDYTGHSDINVPDDLYDGGSGCNVCEKIAAALECPEWDAYMGELTGAIKNALPTLPEWRNIAEQFVDAFADYFGDPPAVPNPTNITPAIPVIDTSVPDADFNLAVPEEFNTPFNFDITSGPEISVVDESEPFLIEDPNKYIDGDEPGVFVYPGDPRNHSDGIKQPDTIITDYPEPVPTLNIPDPDEPPEIPPAEIPVPGETTNIIPIPTPTEGSIALPTQPEGEEEEP